ncbi:MAG: FAD-dependent oxidoreductase [Anaerolineae bacterium]|nr:FAD-dependent oxidoreductase [Anaerolineae bacterium]
MTTISFEREVSVRHEVDVFVAGGGPSGIAAALAAARQGASVYIAEGQACFGGMGTAGLVPAFMCFTDRVNFLADGVGREIYERMKQRADTPRDDPGGSVSINAEALKLVYDDVIQEARAQGPGNIDFTFHTQVIGVDAEGGHVNAAICAAKSGLYAVQAKVFVDGTGDGDLAVWAGAPFEKGDADGHMMPGTLCSLWANVDWDRVSERQDRNLTAAFADNVFTVQDRHLPGMWQVGPGIGGGNIGHTFGVDGTDERSLTQALLWGRRSLSEYEVYYKRYLEGFEAMSLVATGALLGLRETRRIIGDYVLCLDDFESRAVFQDEIGRYNYPVDIHASTPNTEDFAKFEDEFKRLRYETGESYGIPYRILTPRGLDNVLVAGRCVSTDRYMQGSIRVMPGCYITGQAAGVAASLAAAETMDVHAVDVSKLQALLKAQGAYLPNAGIGTT